MESINDCKGSEILNVRYVYAYSSCFGSVHHVKVYDQEHFLGFLSLTVEEPKPHENFDWVGQIRGSDYLVWGLNYKKYGLSSHKARVSMSWFGQVGVRCLSTNNGYSFAVMEATMDFAASAGEIFLSRTFVTSLLPNQIQA